MPLSSGVTGWSRPAWALADSSRSRRPRSIGAWYKCAMRIGILGSGLMGAKLGTLFWRARRRSVRQGRDHVLAADEPEEHRARRRHDVVRRREAGEEAVPGARGVRIQHRA